MKLWKLDYIPGADNGCSPGYDDTHSLIVRATTEQSARVLAAAPWELSRSGERRWLDDALTTCVELTAEGPAETVLRHYMYG